MGLLTKITNIFQQIAYLKKNFDLIAINVAIFN